MLLLPYRTEAIVFWQDGTAVEATGLKQWLRQNKCKQNNALALPLPGLAPWRYSYFATPLLRGMGAQRR